MKSKKKILLSAVLTIVLCLSLIAGTTFALFTSESKVNIAITSGKVKVEAEIVGPFIFSATDNATLGTGGEAGTIDEGPHAATYYYEPKSVTTEEDGSFSGTFTNGGTAEYVAAENELTLDRVTPGDKVKCNVSIGNESNVNIKYRVVVTVTSGLKLFRALKVKINNTNLTGVSRVGNWTWLPANQSIDDIPVEIYLPIEAGNEYQDLSTAMTISVEAVQGNAHTSDEILATTVEAVAEEKTKVNTSTNQTVESTTITDTDSLVTVTIPSDAKLTSTDSADEEDKLSLALKVTPQDTVSKITILSTQTAASYDVSVLLVVNGVINDDSDHAIDKTNTQYITVTMFIGTGLTGVHLYHKDTEIEYDSYDPTTGYITFKTKSFSEYTVVYNVDYAVETFDEDGNSTGIVVYEATEATGVYTTEDGEIGIAEETVVPNVDTVLTAGTLTVTVPAAALKTKNTLSLNVTDSSELPEGFTTASYLFGQLHRFVNIEIDGLSPENTEKLTIKYTLPDVDTGLQYYSTAAYQGSSRLYTNTTKPSYATISDNKEITIHSAVLGNYTIDYDIITGYNPKVTLTTAMNEKEVIATLGSRAYALTGKISELGFTFAPVTLTEEESATLYQQMQSGYGVFPMEMQVTAYGYQFKNFSSVSFNPVYIDFPCTLTEGYTNVYVIGANAKNGKLIDESDTCHIVMSNAPVEGTIVIVTTYASQATQAFRAANADLQEGANVSINSSFESGLIDLKDIEDILSVNGITISGADPELATVVKSTGAEIKANNMTFTNITVYSSGLTLEGKHILVQGAEIDQKYGQGSTLILKGSHGDYTVKDVVLTHATSNTSPGRAGALEINGIRTDLTASEAQKNVTTIDNVTISTEWDAAAFIANLVARYKANGYTEEEIESDLASYGLDDVSQLTDAHTAYKNQSLFYALRNATGIVYRDFGGTLDIKNSNIDIPCAFQIGVDSEPRYGWLNVTDTVINTTQFGTERVDYTTFTRTTFKNDWTDSAIKINPGNSYQGNLNYSFDSCTFETALQFGLGTDNTNTGVYNPTIKFKNCRFGGVLLTAENYEELIAQYLSFSMSVTNLEAVIDTMDFDAGTGELTITVKRQSK